jgi:hypothetical protein
LPNPQSQLIPNKVREKSLTLFFCRLNDAGQTGAALRSPLPFPISILKTRPGQAADFFAAFEAQLCERVRR